MTLDQYLTNAKMSEAAFAERISTHQTTVHRMRKGAIPNPVLMRRVVEETKGRVTANDFYGVEP